MKQQQSASGAQTIRALFRQDRPIDRRIEKVIDYRATEDDRLAREIGEYEVTPSVERGLRRLLEQIQEGVLGGEVAEIGAWVSGYYGSGKSSFTKYLGFALDERRTLEGKPFVDKLADRIPDKTVATLLRTVAKQVRPAVFMIDLGTDQLAQSASVSVANVVFWNVLGQLGFSRQKKVAELELKLEAEGKLEAFARAYDARYPGKEPWNEVHNDPVLAVLRASTLVGQFYPDDFADPKVFRELRTEDSEDVGGLAKRLIDLVRRRRQCRNIVFFVDEVGQYVAPRQELILNLDGFVRSLKEIGQGSVWLIATAQQTLTEISERAALNSAELVRLKDRFPIPVELEASDTRDITARRLLPKSAEGARTLEAALEAQVDVLENHTHLTDWPGARVAPNVDALTKLYPFLPARFDLVLALIHALVRRSGTGLRSAIRVVQDLLVDTHHTLPEGALPLADRPVGQLASVDDIYDTFERDLSKDHRHAVEGVDRVRQHPEFRDDVLAIRAAKAVAALQPLEDYPRTAANIAALLYRELGAPGERAAVEAALQRLVSKQAFGLVEIRDEAVDYGAASPQGRRPSRGGFMFLSSEIAPLQRKRDAYAPSQSELHAARIDALRRVLEPPPQTQLEGTKTVRGTVKLGKATLVGEAGDVLFRLEEVEAGGTAARQLTLETESQTRSDYRGTVFWVYERPADVDDYVFDVCRSEAIQSEGARVRGPDAVVSPDVSRFLRSELRRGELAKDRAVAGYRAALAKGVFVFDGRKRAVAEGGADVAAAASAFLCDVAGAIFHQYAKAKKPVGGEVAQRFLEVTKLDQMPRERDPLELVQKPGGRPSINKGHPALTEVLRAFREQVKASGAGRVAGSVLLETFHAAPYGWSKDTTRYLFAALLVAGEIELHTGDGVLRTNGPKAIEAIKNTQSFGRVGVAPRGEPVPLEALDRASRRLETMFGVEVLPLEDQISRVVRTRFPGVMERVGSLPDRLRLLELRGEGRARAFLQACADLLKEDAGGAASILGGNGCVIDVEERWASGVAEALEKDGEKDLAAAAKLCRRCDELAELFPVAEALAAHAARETIREIIDSEDFVARLPDLRGATRTLQAAAAALELQERAGLDLAVSSAREALRALPAWTSIGEDDRRELDERIEAQRVPAAVGAEDALAGLSRVLTRKLGVADVAERAASWAQGRALPPAAVSGAEVAAAAASAGAVFVLDAAEALDLGPLLPDAPLATAADVHAFVDGLRDRLLEHVAAGPIRLTIGSKG